MDNTKVANHKNVRKDHGRGAKQRLLNPLCLAVNLLAYVGFAVLDGPVWCRDSNSYATMDYTREPIYCTFLWLMRRIFGESILVHGWDLTDREGGKAAAMEPLYLMAAIVCQAILLAITVWYLAKVVYGIGKDLGLKRAAAGGAFAANLVMWGVDALNRFGAKRGSAYFQSIMTEGFGISFYILFLLFLFQYLRSRRWSILQSCASGGVDARAGGDFSQWKMTASEEPFKQGKWKLARKVPESAEGANIAWKRYLAATGVMMVICASHHKQLTITLLIYAAACGLADLLMLVRKKAQVQARAWILRDLTALAAAGGLIFLLGHGYNLVFHGVWSFHTGSADKIDSTLLYTVTEEDAELFDRYGDVQDGEDVDDLKNLFLQVEEQMTEQQLRYVDVMQEETKSSASELSDGHVDETTTVSSGEQNVQTSAASFEEQNIERSEALDNGSSEQSQKGGVSWVELCSHYSDCYDIIGFQVLDPLVDTYVREHHPELEPGTMAFAIETDAVCQRLEKVLLHQDLSRLLYLWINNVRKGFVNTVLRVSTVLNWASLVLWVLYGVLFAAGIRMLRRHFNAADRSCSMRLALHDILLLSGLVFLGTLINCMVVGAIIFPQTRYMIYNMGLFYVCLGLMGAALIRNRGCAEE